MYGRTTLRLNRPWTAMLAATLLMALFAPVLARGQTTDGPTESHRLVEFLGWAREIPRSLSASRDAPAFYLSILPRNVRTAAGEFSLVTFRFADFTLRNGFFGLLELESGGKAEGAVGIYPQSEGGLFWRGSFGYSMALSLDSLAKSFCPRCGLEATLMFRHESEHYTGSNSGDAGMDYSDVPHVGDLVMLDLAMRVASGKWGFVARGMNEFFLPDRSGYSFGPAADFELRYAAFDFAHLALSLHGEYRFGAKVEGRTYPDAYLLRALLGIALPSELGDLLIYLSGDVGHRRGILVFQEEATLGLGVRLGLGN